MELRPQQVYGRKQNIKQRGTLWKQMFHYFSFNQEWFFQQYHKRSNVESTFSMIEASFVTA